MEKGINRDGRRVFPIRPKQITMWSFERNCKNTDNECGFCGVRRKEFVIGSLIEVYLKEPKYPVALIERLNCPKIENEIPDDIKSNAKAAAENAKAKGTFKCEDCAAKTCGINGCADDAFVAWNRTNPGNPYTDKDTSVFYVNYNEDGTYSVYHSYVLSMFYSGWDPENTCYKDRRNSTFFDKCMQIDLCHAKKAFLKKDIIPYKCPKEGRGLWEIAYPILTEEKMGTCAAVMIIGQIPEERYNKNLCNKLKEDVDGFKKVVLEQIGLKNSAYLTRLLEDLINAPEKLNDSTIKEKYREELIVFLGQNEKNGEDDAKSFAFLKKEHIMTSDLTIYSMLKQMRHLCDEAAFYYTPEGDAAYCHILRSSNEKDSFNILKAETIESKEDFIKAFLQEDVESEFCFYQPLSADGVDDYYIGISLQWDDYSKFSRSLKENIHSFAQSLCRVLHDTLMTQISSFKQRVLGGLIRNLHHDLNQKIEIVENHTAVAERRIQAAYQDQYAEAVFSDYVKDIRNMTNQLRYFVDEARTKAADGELPYHPIRFYPYKMFLFNLNEYYDYLSEKMSRIYHAPSTYEVSSDHPNRYPEIYADPVAMERCINNLLSNAVKYSYMYTNIYLDCYYDRKEDSDNYILKVSNFGKRIPDELAERIFEYGFTESKDRGSGIGLAVVKEICEQHKGTVRMESNTVSEFNVPLLYRIMQKYKGNKQQFMEKYPSAKLDFDALIEEYERLAMLPADRSNYVAGLNEADNLLTEVCAGNLPEYVSLTKRYLEATIKVPTERITFTVKLPRNGR